MGEPGYLCGHTLPLSSIPIVSSFALSATVSSCSCSQCPIFQPHHGWEQQQLLEPGFWSAEPMPGGYFGPLTSTPRFPHPALARSLLLCLGDLANPSAGEKRKLPEDLTLEDASGSV